MTAPAPRFLPLAAVTPADAALTGPEAVGLAQALAAAEPVLAGVVLTPACLDAVLRPAGLLEPWQAALAAARRGDLAPASALAPRIAAMSWPPDVAAAVAAAVGGLGEGLGVRGTAIVEVAPARVASPAATGSDADPGQTAPLAAADPDAAAARFTPPSGAVVAAVDLPAAANRAWAALLASDALLHLLAHGRDPGGMKAAVLVQTQLQPRVTGTVLTVDPGDHAVARLTVDATPPVDDQPAPVGPTTVMLPRRGRVPEVPGLATGAATRLRDLARRNERRVGRPLAIDWAWTDAGPVITGIRPIPGLAPGAQDRPAVRWVRDLAAERFPGPISPLGWSALEPALRANMAALEPRFGLAVARAGEAARPIGARVYANQDLLNRFGAWRLRPAAHKPYLGAYLRKLAPLLLPGNWRDLPHAFAPRKGPLASGPCDPRLRGACGVFEAHVFAQAAAIEAEWAEAFPTHMAVMAALAAEDPEAMDGTQRVAYARRLIAANDAYMEPDLAIQLVLAACSWLVGAIAACADDRPAPDLLTVLGGGLEGRATAAMNQALDRLAAAAAADSFLGASMRHGDVAALRTAWGNSPARAVRADFLAAYGHLGPARDLREPTWGERPEVLDGLIAARLRAGGGRTPDATEGAAAREAELERLCALLAPAPWAPGFFRQLVAVLQAFMRLAEEHHLFAGRLIPAQRRLLAVWGQDLAARGVIARPDDLWFLRMDEVLAAAGEAEPFTRAPLASRRRLAFELAVAAEAPAAYLGDRPEPAPAFAAPLDGTLRGEGVGPGFAEGPVRHVRSLADLAAVRAGDIVVVEAPKPAFTPAWAIAGGVVAARGGALAPGLVLAREYGLPAVTGLPDALRLLPDGTRVRLDGFAGTVAALQPAPVVALP